MQNKPTTIKEIAKKLNVSVSTVSRALNNNLRIGLGTRQKNWIMSQTQKLFFLNKINLL
jgi:predicted transcriptional regulator